MSKNIFDPAFPDQTARGIISPNLPYISATEKIIHSLGGLIEMIIVLVLSLEHGSRRFSEKVEEGRWNLRSSAFFKMRGYVNRLVTECVTECDIHTRSWHFQLTLLWRGRESEREQGSLNIDDINVGNTFHPPVIWTYF